MFLRIFTFVIFSMLLSTLSQHAMDNPSPPKKPNVLPKFSNSTNAADKALLMAAATGNLEEVQKALDAGANLNTTSSILNTGSIRSILNMDTIYTINELTALHWAVKNGHESVTRLLLNRRTNIEAKDKYGGTPLHWAAREGHAEVVKLLLTSGALIDKTKQDLIDKLKELLKDNPLATAIIFGDTRALQKLLTPETPYEIFTSSLPYAVAQAQPDALKILISCLVENLDASYLGAQRAAAQNYIARPTNSQQRRDQYQVIINILQDGINQILVGAFKQNNLEKVREALAYEAQIPPAQREKVSQLFQTGSIDSNDKLGELLLVACVHPDELFDAARVGDDEKLSKALSNHFSPQAMNDNGETMLHIAANQGHIVVVKLLLDHGARKNVTDNEGRTPLHAAAAWGHENIVKLLLSEQ